MAAEKGRKVGELKQTNPSNSMEPVKSLESVTKQPGQVGLWAPNNIDAIRKPPKEARVDTGERVFGGVCAPKVSDQTYDCYNPVRKVDPPKKKKE